MYKILIFSLCVSISFLNCSSVLQSPLFSSESTPQNCVSALRTNCCSPVNEIRTLGRSQSQVNILLDKELERFELDKARQNKEKYALPTPASFGELQTDTPNEFPLNYMQEWLNYMQEWLRDCNNVENQLAAWNDYRLWLLKNEKALFDYIKIQYMDEKLSILKKQQEASLSGRALSQAFNVSNRQVIGGGTISS